MTMLENLKEAREPGSALSHYFHRTFAVLAVQLCGSQTASSSDCSFSRDYSAFVYLLRDLYAASGGDWKNSAQSTII